MSLQQHMVSASIVPVMMPYSTSVFNQYCRRASVPRSEWIKGRFEFRVLRSFWHGRLKPLIDCGLTAFHVL